MRICVLTGTRAEYGLLKPLIKKIALDNELELKLVVTAMHLSTEFGLTYKEIEEDGFHIDEKVEMLLSSDTSTSIVKSMGLGLISFSAVLERIRPDLIVILGDRYEALAMAQTAMIMKIPIAHIHGGELTEGAFDDAIRHSITKMSYIHFACAEEYKKRIIQLGEDPMRVFNVGALGAENIKNLKLLTKEQLEAAIDFEVTSKTALITYHPVTLDKASPKEQFANLLKSLDKFQDLNMVFTKANADTNGREINKMIDQYVMENPKKAIAFTSMGQMKYLSAMKHCGFVLGNSSSGIIEAPIFKKPTVNIGDRQKGRLRTESIIDCDIDIKSIYEAIKETMSHEFMTKTKKMSAPYGEGNTSASIIDIIKRTFKEPIELKKSFYDINF